MATALPVYKGTSAAWKSGRQYLKPNKVSYWYYDGTGRGRAGAFECILDHMSNNDNSPGSSAGSEYWKFHKQGFSPSHWNDPSKPDWRAQGGPSTGSQSSAGFQSQYQNYRSY